MVSILFFGEPPGQVIGCDGKQILVKHGGTFVRVHSTRLTQPVNSALGANQTVHETGVSSGEPQLGKRVMEDTGLKC